VTAAEIARLRGLLAGATPGPWERDYREMPDGSEQLIRSVSDFVLGTVIYDGAPVIAIIEPDTRLIVAAVSSLPSLLDAVEAERARAEQAEKERDEARAQQAAAVCAWEEYARWPGDYGAVPIGRTRDADGTEKEWALRPDQITGITRGIERHVRDCLPFGVGAVKSHQDIDGVRLRLDEVARKYQRAESDLAKLRAALDEIGACQMWGGQTRLWCRNDPDDAEKYGAWCDTCKRVSALLGESREGEVTHG